MRVAHFPRDEYLAERFDYQGGEHVTAAEPTQGGKTHLIYQMSDRAMEQNPDLRFVSLMPKSRDPATYKWAERLDLKIVDNWPPPKTWFSEQPRGYVLWPKHLKGAPKEQNRAHLAGIFRKCLNDQFQQGDSITLVDDIYLVAVMLDLNMDCEEFWTAGSSGRAGLWGTLQKPSGTIGGGSVSSFAYNSPTHLILGHDPDQRNRKRFSEIGGVDPEIVSGIVTNLPQHRIETAEGVKNISDKLYIHKQGYMCTVGV
jgi:hypothetical protein